MIDSRAPFYEGARLNFGQTRWRQQNDQLLEAACRGALSRIELLAIERDMLHQL